MSERTPQDFAIEHAEYMAQSAEDLIAAVNDLALAEEQHDDGTANPSDVDAARETLTEMVRDTRSCIYEFRKRRDRAAVQAAQPEAVGEPWGVDANKLLSNAMKPSEINGPADVQRRRVGELLSWFVRLADGQANPKWTAEHAFELAYYIASAPTPEPMSAPTAEPSDADWADFGAWAERDKGAMDLLEKLIDVWDDGQLPHEHRCYVDGAWAELIAEARAAIRATKGGKL